MSKIIGVTLLLIILMATVCHSTASHRVSKMHIRKCRCTSRDGKMICPNPLIPTDNDKKMDLDKCLCEKFQTHCNLRRPPKWFHTVL